VNETCNLPELLRSALVSCQLCYNTHVHCLQHSGYHAYPIRKLLWWH